MEMALLLSVSLASVIGAGMGLFTGIVPGIHVNTLAAMMLAGYPAMEEVVSAVAPGVDAATTVCACVTSASVVHSFVDFVPSVFIGAPDSEDAVSVLPGHRLLLEGRGMAAVRAAAIGSLVGASCATLLSIPLQLVLLAGAGDILEGFTPVVLLVCSGILLSNEFRRGRGTWGIAAFLLSGALGYACMVLPIGSDGLFGEGSLLLPLLSGLFGIPVLLSSSEGGRTPAQMDDGADPVGPGPGLRGVVTGCIAGWFPGITATVGASVAACFIGEDRPERFISTVASVGTVTSVLSLVTLSVSGSGRSGTAMVIGEIMGDGLGGALSEGFLMLLLSTAMGSSLGYVLTLLSGRFMSGVSDMVDPVRMNRAVVAFLLVLVPLLTGPYGLLVLLFSTIVGFLPNVCGVGRTVLCGCLMVPVMAFL